MCVCVCYDGAPASLPLQKPDKLRSLSNGIPRNQKNSPHPFSRGPKLTSSSYSQASSSSSCLLNSPLPLHVSSIHLIFHLRPPQLISSSSSPCLLISPPPPTSSSLPSHLIQMTSPLTSSSSCFLTSSCSSTHHLLLPLPLQLTSSSFILKSPPPNASSTHLLLTSSSLSCLLNSPPPLPAPLDNRTWSIIVMAMCFSLEIELNKRIASLVSGRKLN